MTLSEIGMERTSQTVVFVFFVCRKRGGYCRSFSFSDKQGPRVCSGAEKMPRSAERGKSYRPSFLFRTPDLPDGSGLRIRVQPSCEKYFPCAVGQIRATESAVSCPLGGALRGRHERWCGMRWTLWCRKTSDADSGRQSRVVLAPRCWRQVVLKAA